MTLIQLRTATAQRCLRCTRPIPKGTIAELGFNPQYLVYYHPSCVVREVSSCRVIALSSATLGVAR